MKQKSSCSARQVSALLGPHSRTAEELAVIEDLAVIEKGIFLEELSDQVDMVLRKEDEDGNKIEEMDVETPQTLDALRMTASWLLFLKECERIRLNAKCALLLDQPEARTGDSFLLP